MACDNFRLPGAGRAGLTRVRTSSDSFAAAIDPTLCVQVAKLVKLTERLACGVLRGTISDTMAVCKAGWFVPWSGSNLATGANDEFFAKASNRELNRALQVLTVFCRELSSNIRSRAYALARFSPKTRRASTCKP